MKLEDIEKLVNSRKYEHRIILYQDNGEDVDIEGYVHWLIEEVKRLQFDYEQCVKDKESYIYKYEASLKRLREGIKELIAYGMPKHIEEGLYELLEEK